MKVAIGLSGGVDSAVAAHLLLEDGHEVTGIIMRLKPGDSSSDDIADAKAVAKHLGIELKVLDLRDEFREKIVLPFCGEYANGRTPNPCIECNALIKFGAMLNYALESGCDRIATGHYAGITADNGLYQLNKTDSPKDQSYFLYRLNQFQLSHIVFPIDSMTKQDTRRIAAQAGIPVAVKKDSLEICFVPDNNYHGFLSSMGITSEPGNIVGTNGEILGKHNGITGFTVGQRKGLGAYGKPMFVTSINATDNTVTIGEEGSQYSCGLTADRPSFISGSIPSEPFRAKVKIRYRAIEQPCLITPFENGFRVDFDEPQRSVSPGQSAVIYDGNTVIGGGRIIKQIN